MLNTFGINIIPENEDDRLEALKRYQILNTLPESQFDHIAEMITKVFNVPIALISFVDEKEVFFKGNVGMEGTTHAERGVSLCSLAILSSETLVFHTPEDEPCLINNPLVQGKFALRFYAGAPITTPDGFHIGTVCIVDRKQRFFSKEQITLLKDFSVMIMDILSLRVKALESQELIS